MKYEVIFTDNSSTEIEIDNQKGDSVYSGEDGIIYVHTKNKVLIFVAPVANIKYIKRICAKS